MRRLSAMTLVVAPLLASCSLLGLDDVPVASCSSDEDCMALSRLEHLFVFCRAYYCDDGRCVRHAEGVEICDGYDNDCDWLIDEPSAGESGEEASQTIAPEATALASASGMTVGRAVYSGDAEGATSLAWSSLEQDDGAASYAYLLPDATEPVTGMSMRYASDARVSSLTRSDLAAGCIRWTETGLESGSYCDFGEVAAALGEKVLVAAVSTEACAPGQLRLGFFERGESLPAAIVRGPLRRSNSYLGVDLTPDGACTGGSREGCSGPTSPGCGVARPALDVIDSAGRSQALVAWIGDDQARDECGGDEAPVEMIAAFLQRGVLEAEFEWITTSNEAVPQRLGTTTAGGPPAVVAFWDRGYFVAYGSAGGGISLHFIPTPPAPADYDGHSCEPPGCSGPDDRTGLETGPITGVVDLPELDAGGAGPVNDVALSLAGLQEGGVDLGVAWREGCGEAGEGVYFRSVMVSVDGLVPSGVVDPGPVVRLDGTSADDARLGPPAIAARPLGFVEEGFSRGGSAEASGWTAGGWYVAWAEVSSSTGRGEIVARRILALDGLPVDETERISLSGASPDADARAPALLAAEERVRFIYYDAASSTFEGGLLGCAAR